MLAKENFNIAIDIFKRRKAENTYVPKKLNILLSWHDITKREKNAVAIIGALAR